MNKNIIAETLLEIAKYSKTIVVEDSNQELTDAAAKMGIVIPSPDLAILKTVYAEIDKVNRNGVVLPRQAVIDGLPTLIGKQVNWEHMGAYQVCGYTIDASINEDKVEIIAVVFKSLFPEEFSVVKEKFESGTLAVSFEIWNKNPETGKSVVSAREDGFVEISPILFHGTGLLLTSQPACPKAKVYKLIAKEEIVDEIFHQDLVYAGMAVEPSKCSKCDTCTCEKEEHKVEEIQKIEEVNEIAKKLCPECQQPLMDDEQENEICSKCKTKKDEHMKSEVVKEIKPEEVASTEVVTTTTTEVIAPTPEETIEATTEPVVESKTEEVVPAEASTEAVIEQSAQYEQTVLVEPVKVIKIISEEITLTEDIPDGENHLSSRKGIRRTTTLLSDGTTEVREEEYQFVEKFTRAEIDNEVSKVQSEYNIKLEEKDKEIANLKQELGKKDQEIAKVEDVKPEGNELDLTVGNVTTGNDKYMVIQKQINKRAFGHE